MELQELKVLEENSAYCAPWELKFLALSGQNEKFVTEDFGHHLKVSKVSEVEKVRFIEDWVKATEAERYILEEALICDGAGRLLGRRW